MNRLLYSFGGFLTLMVAGRFIGAEVNPFLTKRNSYLVFFFFLFLLFVCIVVYKRVFFNCRSKYKASFLFWVYIVTLFLLHISRISILSMLSNLICFAVLTSDLIMSVSSSDNSSSAWDTLRALMRSPRSPPQLDLGESSIQPQPVPPACLFYFLACTFA